jgi:hypothetical protein
MSEMRVLVEGAPVQFVSLFLVRTHDFRSVIYKETKMSYLYAPFDNYISVMEHVFVR